MNEENNNKKDRKRSSFSEWWWFLQNKGLSTVKKKIGSSTLERSRKFRLPHDWEIKIEDVTKRILGTEVLKKTCILSKFPLEEYAGICCNGLPSLPLSEWAREKSFGRSFLSFLGNMVFLCRDGSFRRGSGRERFCNTEECLHHFALSDCLTGNGIIGFNIFLARKLYLPQP